MFVKALILLISWLFPITIVVYLLMVRRVVAKLKNDQAEYWEKITSPSLTDPSGQAAIFWKVICGIGVPKSVSSAFKKELMMVRVLLIFGSILFVVIITMMFGGAFG